MRANAITLIQNDIVARMAVRVDVPDNSPGDVARSAGCHISLTPDQLEHGRHIFVIFVLVSHMSIIWKVSESDLHMDLTGHMDDTSNPQFFSSISGRVMRVIRGVFTM